MSDEKSLWPTCVASTIGAIVYGCGISRANKKGTDTWLEMFHVVEDAVFWVLTALFALVVFAAIILVFKVTLEKVRGVFVAWDKSELWCLKIETSFDDHTKAMEDLKEKCQQLVRRNDYLTDKLEELYQRHFELKKLTGVDVKKIEMDAEKEITGNA